MKNIQIPNLDKLYLVTRRDLSAGYQGVQPLHALAEFALYHPSVFFHWQIKQKNIVLLSVENEETLKSLYNEIKGEKALFNEPDINNELTAIAFFPTEEDIKLTKKLPLALNEYMKNNTRDLVLKVV